VLAARKRRAGVDLLLLGQVSTARGGADRGATARSGADREVKFGKKSMARSEIWARIEKGAGGEEG
jgi:hypothetical protein